VTDSRVRDLGAIIPGAEWTEPFAPEFVPRNPVAALESLSEPVFASDLPQGVDELGVGGALEPLAELIAHRRAETPLTIGLFGPSGSGKSFALAKLITRVEDLSREGVAHTSPYVGNIAAVAIDAGELGEEPAAALGAALHKGLARQFPHFADEAARAAADPHAAFQEAVERLDAARHKLDDEKRMRDDASVRRARLTDAILYETPGSQIDDYAASKRRRITALLGKMRAEGDPILVYKDMVEFLEDADNAGRRASLALRAFFALKGQRNLLVLALFLFIAGATLGFAGDPQAASLSWLRGSEPLAGWLASHTAILMAMREFFFVAAALALSLNAWRGLQLLRLVWRGADLLNADLIDRRRGLNEILSFRTRRVDSLSAEVAALSRRATDAEQRLSAMPGGKGRLAELAPFSHADPSIRKAGEFASVISALLAKPDTANRGSAPGRILIALDHIDSLSAARASEVFLMSRSLFKHGFVLVITADPLKLGASGIARHELDRWIQVPFQLSRCFLGAGCQPIIIRALGGNQAGKGKKRGEALFALDEPLTAEEINTLTSLANLAGDLPRAAKRWINLYRLARTNKEVPRGALAFMLALDAGGTDGEIRQVREMLAAAEPEDRIDLRRAGPRIEAAWEAAASQLSPLKVADARRAAAAAAVYSFRQEAISE